MVMEVPQNEEISGGRIEGEKESVLPSAGEAYTLRKKSEEELLREMLVPT